VIVDPTDPCHTAGIVFTVKDLETPANNLSVSAASSNPAVVPLANITVTGIDTIRILRIIPVGIGYSDIKFTINDGTDSTTYIINYASSASAANPSSTYWHTGLSDASDAVALDDDYYITGDDELDVLNVYSRKRSGLPLVSYNYASNLALPDPGKPEADIEAATHSLKDSSKVYWLGSMSNGKAPFDNKPNRDRIFATGVSGTGAATTFTFGGYAALKSSLLAWGDAHNYDFTASAAAGKDSKQPDGFAAEGMCLAPIAQLYT
jgi:hypothetical protein